MDGAVSDDGISEAEINLTIALKLQNLLEQSGATVILTRSDENGIYDVDKTTLKQKKVSDIRNRVKIGNSSSADIFVSIHLNKIPQEQYSGWQTFFKKDNEQGEKLATAIQESLKEAVGKENNRLPMKLDNVYIVKNVEIPLTIVDMWIVVFYLNVLIQICLLMMNFLSLPYFVYQILFSVLM